MRRPRQTLLGQDQRKAIERALKGFDGGPESKTATKSMLLRTVAGAFSPEEAKRLADICDDTLTDLANEETSLANAVDELVKHLRVETDGEF